MTKNPSIKKTILVVSVIVFLFLIAYWQLFSGVSAGDSPNVLFKIENGRNLAEVADNLYKEGLIRSPKTFSVYARIRGLDTSIHSGRYQLTKGMNIKEILESLTNTDQKEISVTIPEGFAVSDIDERLSKLGLITPGEFEMIAQNKEGYLFPDTYFVLKNNFDPEVFATRMNQNFFKKLTPEMIQTIEKQKKSIGDIIIMASILEKEARHDADYPVISGILWKRLESDWLLQADATLLYGKNSITITKKELSEDSPYNTRTHKGLPPTPINNPGIKAITAAIWSTTSSYWFYLSDKEGVMHYARTNEEHNENKGKYL